MKLFFVTILMVALFPAHPHAASKLGSVDWHQGSVDSAFKRAKKENKAIFLYWGANWCPPCNHMKKKVFTTKVFADEMRQFIPVYLDGDEKRAQVWGEKLGAKGYPTMLVLSPAGQEITRLSSAMDAQKYVEVLKKARLQTMPIDKLLTRLQSKALTTEQWDLLANYSWAQDHRLQQSYLAADQKENTFLNLYQQAPQAFKTKFFLQYLLVKTSPYTAKQRKLYRGQFENIITNQQSLRDNFEVLAYRAPDFIKALRKDEKDQHLQQLYLKHIQQYRTSLVKDAPRGRFEEKLMTYVPELLLIKSQQGKDYRMSKVYQRELEQLVGQIAKHENNKYARHSALTSAVWLLSSAHLPRPAKALALQEIKTSPHPYYYMSYLAHIEFNLGNTKSALKWSKQAWDRSVGHATRFEWGTSYLLKLIKHDESNAKAIKTTFDSLMQEYKSESSDFNGRNKRRLNKLKSSINQWNEKFPKSKIAL